MGASKLDDEMWLANAGGKLWAAQIAYDWACHHLKGAKREYKDAAHRAGQSPEDTKAALSVPVIDLDMF